MFSGDEAEMFEGYNLNVLMQVSAHKDVGNMLIRLNSVIV